MTDSFHDPANGRRKDSGTLVITTGAMILAVFALLLLLNRQTGGFFEEFFIYALPIPMVIYVTKFGWRNGLMVFVGMTIFAFLFGTFSAIFYAVSAGLLGIVLGTCFNRQYDMTKTLILSMVLGAVFSVLSSVVLASLFGYDVTLQVDEMQNMMNQVISSSGLPDTTALMNVFNRGFLTQMFIISMTIYGLIDGFIVYQLSILILKRLRFQVPPAVRITEIYPPAFTGFLALAAFLFGNYVISAGNPTPVPTGLIQGLWATGYLYLLIFGIIAFCLFLYTDFTRNRLLIGILAVVASLILPQILVYVGFGYISLGLHKKILED